MVQDTIKTLRRRKSNIAGKDDSKQIPSVSDQISRTCAALLYSIPEQTLQVDIVHDLIQLLQDLATIASIGVLADPLSMEKILKYYFFQELGGANLILLKERK